MAVKVTLLFNYTTKNSAGQAERSAGFSESYYSTLGINDTQLQFNWDKLCVRRAAILAANVSIIGSRYQEVDPVGGSRQYDNKYPGGSSPNDLPGVALQWTVRGAGGSRNQRSVILRGIPDAAVVTGEYSPAGGLQPVLSPFFAELMANWKFRAIDRTVLPVRIIDITANVMTTAGAHGLNEGDIVNIMSTFVGTDPGVKKSYRAFVRVRTSANVVTLSPLEHVILPNSTNGRVRKASIIYPAFEITNGEIANPTATHRKAGSPFKKFRGRRTGKRK